MSVPLPFRRGLAARALRNGSVSGPSHLEAILGWLGPARLMLSPRYLRGVQSELAVAEYHNRLG